MTSRVCFWYVSYNNSFDASATYLAIRHFAAAQVENTFFKVHRYYLTRESEVFRTMFSCPSSEHGQEGVDDSKPIHLPGVTSRQFEALLDFFYEGSAFLPDLGATIF